MSVLSATLLDRRDSDGRNLWRLNVPYRYCFGPNCEIEVPAGYVTNFGTVPRFFYRLVTPESLREASVVHDYMCNEIFNGSHKSGYSRWIADAVFYQAMCDMRVAGPIRRWLVYKAVRFWSVLTGGYEQCSS